MNTKIIVMYLPQFHEIPENNEWWGKGFTEWTNVKKAFPLFRGHSQPQFPYQRNYYDLSDPKVMQGQMKLAKEYGIDGFCIYHYWFNGKKLLEKPLEHLLSIKKTELPFCICWANEPWSRRWDGQEGENVVLMPQSYGGEEDWKKHFYYLIDFFKHDNYIKVDEKPVIVIYKSYEIKRREEMYLMWNSLALQEGFKGVYIISVRRTSIAEEPYFIGDEIMDFEPFATLRTLTMAQQRRISHICEGCRKDNRKIKYTVYDYEKFCKLMVDRYITVNGKHNLGFFAGWDNTPRRGIETVWVFENNTPEIFRKYFTLQYQRSLELNNRFLFINAWNEWGEGTCLEPSERYNRGYLEAIREVKYDFNNF